MSLRAFLIASFEARFFLAAAFRATLPRDLVSMFTGGATYYYHYDQLGSVANLTSATGAAQWSYGYEPFGSLRTETKNATQAPTNLMRFTGELLDLDMGLYHLRARSFDPGSGRFLSSDPLPVQSARPVVSLYAYVDQRPTVMTDPAGLRGARPECWTAALGQFSPLAFLEGTAPVPCAILNEYDPVLVSTPLGPRLLKPSGECSGPLTEKGPFWDFEKKSCLAHDYGYDLIRSGAVADDDLVDLVFLADLKASCKEESAESLCSALADVAYTVVRVWPSPDKGDAIEP